MGRTSIYTGGVFALIGLLAGVYALSLTPVSNLPTPVLIVLCPAGILAALAPASEMDTDFMWLIAILNSLLYGAVGVLLARLFHVDEE